MGKGAAELPQDGLRWWQKPSLLKLNLCLLSLFLSAAANGYYGSMTNGLQALPQWQHSLNSPKSAWLGFINAVQSLGAFACFPFVAWSNNRFGRKKTIAVAFFWLLAGVSVQTSAQNPAIFIIGRMCIGGVSAFFGASVPS
ncbi:sugar transporter [Fusarium mexicanum]|uniref:Sugar transporter n=1 Tax=Fusarium mexicanum TaxID=751941 RepID=A0A8H5MZN8_9HYPO|nr:sugar transporter [Fusarium mexicanum]